MHGYNLESLLNSESLFMLTPSLPNALARACIGLFVICFCFVMLPVKKSFFEQCAGALQNETNRVLANGFVAYFMLFFLSLIFMLTVIGFPVAAFFMLCGVLACLLGEIAVGIWLGCFLTQKLRFLTQKLNVAKNAYSNLAFGVIIIETAKLLPYAGLILSAAVLPVLCLGAVYTGIYNAFVKRRLYELPYWREDNG